MIGGPTWRGEPYGVKFALLDQNKLKSISERL